ncbi:MAG: phosphoribosylanthranilate isomerase [Candidatus Omnitrophica bacterium]|nr:phosphoribosylanthranilate isomerase [Candidatus Omnitrophota bacterium]
MKAVSAMHCQIKICGITNQDDLELIAKCGADFGGVLVEIDSPRGLILEKARDLFSHPPLPAAAVTVDRSPEELAKWAAELHPFALQLHGHESPDLAAELKPKVECEIWKVIHLPAAEENEPVDVNAVVQSMNEFAQAGVDRFIVDATIQRGGKRHLGGTGKTVDWRVARALRDRSPKPFMAAGGIHPGNAVEAAAAVRPDGIDLSSGVELTKGKKDPDRVLQLIARVRAWERSDEIC